MKIKEEFLETAKPLFEDREQGDATFKDFKDAIKDQVGYANLADFVVEVSKLPPEKRREKVEEFLEDRGVNSKPFPTYLAAETSMAFVAHTLRRKNEQ